MCEMARSSLVAWSDQQDGHIQLQNFFGPTPKILGSFGTFFALLFDGAAGGMEWFGWILRCRGPVCLLIGSVSSGLLEYQYIIRGVARHGTSIHAYGGVVGGLGQNSDLGVLGLIGPHPRSNLHCIALFNCTIIALFNCIVQLHCSIALFNCIIQLHYN